MHVQHRWLWVPAFAGTTSPRLKQPPSIDTPLRSRRTYARVLSQTFCPLPSEGAGNAGRLVRPQPRVVVENTRVSHHGHTGNARHSPRNGFNGFLRALLGDRAFLSPSLASNFADLTPASRRQDHTTSPSALAPFVKGAIRVHRIPHSTSVTIAKRPSCRSGTGRVGKGDLPDGKSGKFFARDLDKRQTERWLICTSGKSPGL